VFGKTLEGEDGRYLNIALSIIFMPMLIVILFVYSMF